MTFSVKYSVNSVSDTDDNYNAYTFQAGSLQTLESLTQLCPQNVARENKLN